jgi:hypothetical protein
MYRRSRRRGDQGNETLRAQAAGLVDRDRAPSKIKQGDTIGLYSISDSAHWFNNSDLGLVISRPADDGDAELRVAKVRYEEIGRRGSVKIRFNPETRRFHVPVELFK